MRFGALDFAFLSSLMFRLVIVLMLLLLLLLLVSSSALPSRLSVALVFYLLHYSCLKFVSLFIHLCFIILCISSSCPSSSSSSSSSSFFAAF